MGRIKEEEEGKVEEEAEGEGSDRCCQQGPANLCPDGPLPAASHASSSPSLTGARTTEPEREVSLP